MDILLYIGVAMAVAGLAGIVWCILQALPLRGASADDAAAKARLQSLLFWNAASFGAAFFGLGLGVVGALLG